LNRARQDKLPQVSKTMPASDTASCQDGALPFDFMAVSRPPTSPEGHARLREEMDHYILQSVSAELSQADRRLLGPPTGTEKDEGADARIEHALDEVIIGLAATFGWRLYFSDRVRDRMFAWQECDPDGTALLNRFHRQQELHARANQEGVRVPLEPRYQQVKLDAQTDFKLLRERLRAEQAKQRRALNKETVLTLVNADLDRHECPYPFLQNNRAVFKKFIASKPDVLTELLTGGITPAILANTLIGAVTNYTPESVRQALSTLRTRRLR